jgi:diacylglycerol kinase family enzyme
MTVCGWYTRLERGRGIYGVYVYVMLACGTYSATKASYGSAAQLVARVREGKKGSFTTISSLSHLTTQLPQAQ